MRIVPRAIARSAVLAGLGLLVLVAPLSAQGPAPSPAQGTSQITLTVDLPIAGVTVDNGRVYVVGGWAGVPGGRDSGIRSVEVYLDGGPGTGTLLGLARLGVARDDVARATSRPEWGRSGFNFDWVPRDVSAGPHTLHVVARAVTGGTTTQTVDVNGSGSGSSARGSFTNPMYRQIAPGVWERDTGGPGVSIERDYRWPWW
jgi:hypothetical protein